jgi:hypothetical protein
MNQMTRQEILEAILPLNDPANESRRLNWLTALGYQMTVSARIGYPTVKNNIKHLVAFNEMQHQLYNYLQHPHEKEEWKIEDFLEGLRRYAVTSGVEGDFGAAVHSSLRQLTRQ